MWPYLVVALVVWLGILFWGLCLVRTGRDEDRLRERLGRRTDLALARESTATVDRVASREAETPVRDPEEGVDGYYHTNFFI